MNTGSHLTNREVEELIESSREPLIIAFYDNIILDLTHIDHVGGIDVIKKFHLKNLKESQSFLDHVNKKMVMTYAIGILVNEEVLSTKSDEEDADQNAP